MENKKLLNLLHNTVPLSNTVFSGGIMSFFIYFLNDVLKEETLQIETNSSSVLIDGNKTDPKTIQYVCISLCVMNFLISIANVTYSKMMKTENNKTSDEKKELTIQNASLSDQISRLSNFSSDGKNSSDNSVDMEMENRKEPY